jgi:tRNA(Ile)-lysidine synthase
MTWTTLHANLHRTIRQRHLLEKGQSIVLGFSGGQDSMCLLQLLRDLQPKWAWRLAIAHCDHRWPPDSGDNADYVARLAQEWNLECHQFTAPQILKGEAEGRTWRYQVLTELARQQGFNAVLTAHTASDRAETLLYNLFRGSGMDGLQALAWQRPLSAQVSLIRPLLAVTRQQTLEFCRQLQLPIWQDGMNEDLIYRRNRIRLTLLPLLRQHFNPQIDATLAKTADILQAETEYLEVQAKDLLGRALIPESILDPPLEASSKSVLSALNQPILQKSPVALQRRAVRHWLASYLPSQPNFEQIEKVVALIDGHNGDRTDPFTAGIVAEVRRPFLCLVKLDKKTL